MRAFRQRNSVEMRRFLRWVRRVLITRCNSVLAYFWKVRVKGRTYLKSEFSDVFYEHECFISTVH